VEFLQADILSWDYPRNSFDVVISQEIIEHVKDQRAYLDVAHGLLHKGGYLILTTPNARTMYAMSDKRREKWANQPIENWLTAKELKRLLINDFEIIRFETIVFNFAVKGLYKVVDSQRLRSFLIVIGLSRAFDSLRSSLGFGLHFVVLARKK
jgi:ubiquinone/menaquinone biosynthesis C-methylase UbiE